MSNILAAIGIGQLEVLANRVEKKREVNRWYRERLSDVAGIEFMPEPSFAESNNWLTVIQVDANQFGATPRELIAALGAENIEARPVWNPLHLQKAFEQYRCVGGNVAESIYRHGVCLPSGSQLTRDDVDRVAQILLGTKVSIC